MEIITRRTFVKKSSLTLGSLALLSRGSALGATTGTPPSCPIKVSADPDDSIWLSGHIIDTAYGIGAKLKTITTPSGGPADAKDIAIQAEIWEDGDYANTKFWSAYASVWGTIDHLTPHGDCPFRGGVNNLHTGRVSYLMGAKAWGSKHQFASEPATTFHQDWATLHAVLEVTDSHSDDTEAYLDVSLFFEAEVSDNITDTSTGQDDMVPTRTDTTKGTTTGEITKKIRVWKT